MKQPDKMTAYYYRAAYKKTDKHLDNQMHRLLTHAQESGKDTYLIFADNGYSGTSANRPAFQNLLYAVHANQIRQIVVTSIDRLNRDALAGVRFIEDMKLRGVDIYSIVDGGQPQHTECFRIIGHAYRDLYEKGGERK